MYNLPKGRNAMYKKKEQRDFIYSKETLSLIKAVMKERQISIITVAKEVGLSPLILSDQLYFRRSIKKEQIKKILKYLEITVELDNLSSIDRALGELGYIREIKKSNIIKSIHEWGRYNGE